MKTAKSKAKKKGLTNAEVVKLGTKLIGTSGHVHNTAEAMFGIRTDDKIFQRLEVLSGIKKCFECGSWLNIDEEYRIDSDFCNECDDAMNEENDE